jgi:hypothetical protein
MNVHEAHGIRELTAEEIEDVSGGFSDDNFGRFLAIGMVGVGLALVVGGFVDWLRSL